MTQNMSCRAMSSLRAAMLLAAAEQNSSALKGILEDDKTLMSRTLQISGLRRRTENIFRNDLKEQIYRLILYCDKLWLQSSFWVQAATVLILSKAY